MARGDPLTSPWVWSAADYLGRTITITSNFNNATRALQASSVVRAAGCLYGHLYIGLGGDGTPDSTTKSFAVPVGTTSITANQMSAKGLNTIDDVLALQITAGP
jgi:hypothetical protein